MNIVINQQTFTFEAEVTLAKALEVFKATAPFAVMLNDAFLPQSHYHETWLKEGDNIEVVGAIQGG